MTPEQAIAAVRTMTFRPGWKLDAEKYDSTRVDIFAEVDTFDTSYADAGGSFYRRIHLQPSETIDVSDLNLAGLCHAIMTKLVEPFDQHENREFLQVRTADGWYAPLHPHTPEGQRAWYRGAGERAARFLAELNELGVAA